MRRGAVGVEEGRGEGNWRGEGKGGLSLGRRAVRVGVWCGPWGCADVPWKRPVSNTSTRRGRVREQCGALGSSGSNRRATWSGLDACEWDFGFLMKILRLD